MKTVEHKIITKTLWLDLVRNQTIVKSMKENFADVRYLRALKLLRTSATKYHQHIN